MSKTLLSDILWFRLAFTINIGLDWHSYNYRRNFYVYELITHLFCIVNSSFYKLILYTKKCLRTSKILISHT